jgi:S1-C subfamily serine protease
MNIKSILLAAILALSPVLSYADPLVDQVFTPSVHITIGTANSPDGFCSGEIIKSDRDAKSGKVSTYVLTAKHCVKDNEKADFTVTKKLYDKNNKEIGSKTYLADSFGTSYKSDLALLKLRDQDTYFDTVATVAKKDTTLTFGQTVELIGYPLGRSMTWTEGKLGYIEKVDQFSDVSQSTYFQRATPEMAPGSSGSSMFVYNDTDKKYEVIGVLTGGPKNWSWMGFYTPIDEINDYLDTALKTDTPPKTGHE